MRFFAILAAAFLITGLVEPAWAQDGQFSSAPVCSDILNKTGFTVYGNVETDKAVVNGKTIYHKSNFRLSKDENTRICASGPFFEGNKLRLVLRSLLPVFECKTKLGKPITLTATPRESGLGYDWKASCYE